MQDPINLALNPNGGGDARGLGNVLDTQDQIAHENESGIVCRICLEEEEESDNPFITPCKCTGSMKYIHLKCLREWTDSKKQFQTDTGIMSYYWENLNCELCKAQLDLVLQSATDSEKAMFLLDFDRPKDQPYMIIESDIDCASKAVHILNLSAKNSFIIGRRVSSDISVSDISVSRRHSTI